MEVIMMSSEMQNTNIRDFISVNVSNRYAFCILSTL